MSKEYQVYIGIEEQDGDDCHDEGTVTLEVFDNLSDAEAHVGSCQQIDKLRAENKSLKETIKSAAKIAAKKVYRQPDKMELRKLLKESDV